jgi:transposase
MKAYSEDLRKKIVDAVEQRGMRQSQAAGLTQKSLASLLATRPKATASP